MFNSSRTPKIIRVRWHAEQPPTPLGCRWCGHPPYAHDAASLPHRPGHLWEQPTPAQVRTRMTARRRLGLCGRLPAPPVPTTVPPRPTNRSPISRGRHSRPAAPPYGRESPPGLRPGRREAYRKGVTA
ncbi:hypothetical protein ACWCSH_31695 [Streptosporangium sp. NPDC001682]